MNLQLELKSCDRCCNKLLHGTACFPCNIPIYYFFIVHTCTLKKREMLSHRLVSTTSFTGKLHFPEKKDHAQTICNVIKKYFIKLVMKYYLTCRRLVK